MNIFYLDKDPQKCAQMHGDKHVIKMILESAQMLCSVHWHFGHQAHYKKTHINHPCAKWARESDSNYMWLARLAKELCFEYRYRYGMYKRHKAEDVIDWLIDNVPKELPSIEFRQPPLAMPEEYKNNDHINAYRDYYVNDKRHLMVYTKRECPYWA